MGVLIMNYMFNPVSKDESKACKLTFCLPLELEFIKIFKYRDKWKKIHIKYTCKLKTKAYYNLLTKNKM